ncbi:MAG: phosphoglycerate kinase [Acidimicrobiales bacterium]|nr:phosphoglycerate kinase [Acidimicrobiales bacterium]
MPVLEDLPDPAGRAVLVRADLNVPLSADARRVADDFRIRAALPTMAWLLERGARLTVCSHLGRPHGRPDPRWSIEPVRARLSELLGPDRAPSVRLMENLRFDPGEEANDPAFVDRLVAGQDLYVDDAFGAAHRAHASIVGPPERLPSAGGRLLVREAEVLGGLLAAPARPFVAVLGGAKVSEKLGLLRSLLDRVDRLLVGGGMCFTFLAAEGHDVGDSLMEPEQVDGCRSLLEQGRKVVVPEDIVAFRPEPGPPLGAPPGEVRVVGRDVPAGWKGMDIGPESAARFAEEIARAATVFWNGPMGVFEDERFAAGTASVAEAVAACPGFTVVGGGDSAAALAGLGLEQAVDHLSTGGGASLELLEQGDLPGLAALRASAASRASSAVPSARGGPGGER